MNLHQKILAIMGEVGYLQKDDRVKFGTTDYKALSEEKVTTIMREKMVKYGLVVYPIQQQTTRTGQITHVDVTYRMVNAEDPLDYIDIVSCGDGADTQDKGAGKAMTYAYKYMWLRTFLLATGEDPDKISSEELDDMQARVAQIPEPVGMADKFSVGCLETILQREGKSITPEFLAWVSSKVGRDIQSPYDLTQEEIDNLCTALETRQKKKKEAAAIGQ